MLWPNWSATDSIKFYQEADFSTTMHEKGVIWQITLKESEVLQFAGNRSRSYLKVRESVGVNIIREQRLGGGNNRGRVDPITLRLFTVLKGPLILYEN